MTFRVLPPIIQNADAIADLMARLKVAGPTPRFELFEGVLPVVVVDDPSTLVTRPAIGGTQQAAVALEQSAVMLFNPATSRRDLEIEDLSVSPGAAMAIELRNLDAALTANVAQTSFRDRRLPGTPIGQIRASTEVAQAGATIGRIRIGGGDLAVLPFSMILAPGQGFMCVGITLNVALAVTYQWQEVDR